MQPAHVASAHIEAPASFAVAQFASPAALGRWTLGSMDYVPTDLAGVYRGVSLFDGSESLVEPRLHADLGIIDYHVGTHEQRLLRVSIRVLSGAALGLPADTCLAAMAAFRAGGVTDERWHRTCVTHALEALLFKAQIEAAWKARA